jgi:hypothetical protein
MHNNEQHNAEKIAESVLGAKFDTGNVGNGSYLDISRNTKGRVMVPQNIIGVKDKSEIDQFKAKKRLRAGLMKAGWVTAGNAIKAKTRVAAWLKKGISSLGSGRIFKTGWKTTVELVNRVKYASENISSSEVQAAVQNAYTNKVKQLKKQVEHLAKKV